MSDCSHRNIQRTNRVVVSAEGGGLLLGSAESYFPLPANAIWRAADRGETMDNLLSTNTEGKNVWALRAANGAIKRADVMKNYGKKDRTHGGEKAKGEEGRVGTLFPQKSMRVQSGYYLTPQNRRTWLGEKKLGQVGPRSAWKKRTTEMVSGTKVRGVALPG